MLGRHVALTVIGAAMLAACGDVTADGAAAGATDVARQLLDPATIAEQLPPEARGVVTSYQRDLRTAAAAHVAEFGELPTSFADVASVEGARTAAVNVLTEAIGEQVPFASSATIQQAANGLVSAAERQILDQMRTENAPHP